MLLKYFYDSDLAQASYMVGCAEKGEALVVDPARDIRPYLQFAEREGLRITQVAETHIHADFVSGSRELASATGAMVFLSEMGGEDWQYASKGESNVIPVHDGDAWMMGNIRIEAVHTPGHTPEHLSLVVTDTATADKPIGVFTGDFLFVGDVGRPDLLEEAAGFAGTKENGARQQFHSVERFKDMPDYLQIWPGHGAGSACGKALGAIPSTTLGYEKLFNPAFQFSEEDAFVEWLLADQPEAPRYFAQMKRVNKEGPALLGSLPEPKLLDAQALEQVLDADEFVVDFRSVETFAAGHAPGTINIPGNEDMFTTYVGWFVDYEKPFYFIPTSLEDVDELVTSLRAIGVDNIPGYFGPTAAAAYGETMLLLTVDELAPRYADGTAVVIDVRSRSEYREEHILGALHIPLGYLPKHLDQIPSDGQIVTQCASGYRSSIAASFLRKHGFENVSTLRDDEESWSDSLPTESVAVDEAEPVVA